jgi:hypothetical protein
LAKNTEADFRISFALRSSNTSRAQLLDLLTLLRGEDVTSLAAVGLSLAHLLPQRLTVDPQLVSDVRDRAFRFERQANAALDQLLWNLFGLGITEGSPLPLTKPRNRALLKRAL